MEKHLCGAGTLVQLVRYKNLTTAVVHAVVLRSETTLGFGTTLSREQKIDTLKLTLKVSYTCSYIILQKNFSHYKSVHTS